jgi:hexosaminidase
MPKLPPLLPQPRRADPKPGRFALRECPIVLRQEADDGDFASAQILAERIHAACGRRLPIESHARSQGLGPHIELTRSGADGEGYAIDAGRDHIRVTAEGPAGLRWAIETLAQLVDARGGVPACHIEDAPAFRYRGVMLDVCRGKVPTLACLQELVDRCARLKLNVLMLHQEHAFQFRRHPEIGIDASPMDAETLRAVDAYAAANHVDFVPCLQSLGHMGNILGLERYAHMAESDARWTISPSVPETYEFLAELYDEYLPNFRSGLFNANCDEPFDLEQGRSKERGRELGGGGVFLDHVRRIRDLAAGHGKRTLVWGDVVHKHPGRIPEIDRDLILLDWWYEAQFDYERVKQFADNEIEFWVCPGTSTWNCLFPRTKNSLANISGYADAGRRHGAGGLLVTDWGDFGHYNLLGNSWFAYAWAAQEAWSGPVPDAHFDKAFSRLFFGDASGAAGRAWRTLGDIHEPGFKIFNGSALQILFFDDLETAHFLEATRDAALNRCRSKLEKVRERLQVPDAFGKDILTRDELLYAADASLFAVRKASAGRAWIAWRRNPSSLKARERRRLARELAALATEQTALARQLRRLWLARSEVSNLARTKKRIDVSIRGLRRAARALEKNRPPAPPPTHPGLKPADAFVAMRDGYGRF